AAGFAETSNDVPVAASGGDDLFGWNTHADVGVNAPNGAPTVSTLFGTGFAGLAGQSFRFSSLSAGSDSGGDALTHHDASASDNGYGAVNVPLAPAPTTHEVTAQLTQTTFLAGVAETVDHILGAAASAAKTGDAAPLLQLAQSSFNFTPSQFGAKVP